jgi:hypothetical protein
MTEQELRLEIMRLAVAADVGDPLFMAHEMLGFVCAAPVPVDALAQLQAR